MDESLNPSSRPRRGVLAVLGAGVATALIGGAIVLGGSDAVEASGLATFSSCGELREWGDEAMGRTTESFEEIGAPIAADAAAESSSAGAAGGADGAASAPGPASTTVPAAAMAEESDSPEAADSTNVIVEGIDEPDLVERLGGDRALVVGGQTLAVADLAAASIEASIRVPWGAQITYDADAGVAWSVGYDDRGETLVQRFAVGDGAITDDGSWSTSGQLVSARRQGGELLLVATDWFDQPVTFEEVAPDGGGATGDPGAAGVDADVDGGDPGSIEPDVGIPFDGAPVPCDQVLHPVGPAEPSSTLVVVLPVSGPLEPVRSTQVVGSGSNVHVTADAAYLATPTWDPADGAQSTGLHRFDLASLTHTGSGEVEGSLLNDFALSEHEGHLRVAVTVGGGFIGIPMPVDGGIGDGEPLPSEPVLDGPADSPMVDEPGAATETTVVIDPDTPVLSDGEPPAVTGSTDPGEAGVTRGSDPAGASEVAGSSLRSAVAPTTSTTTTSAPDPAPDTIVGEPDGPETTTTVADPSAPDVTVPDGTIPPPDDPIGTIVEDPIPVDPFPGPTVVEPGPGMDAINEIVVLDIDGDLDVVGRTPRFGHPGESLQGIRFEGDIAYAVTFLQTDPFYVVDLADPTAPTILGELELPGFSAYLHPISATEVVGFGPDESGRASAKLFDVSDRSNPAVVDSIVLGDESAVVWDHHAFTSLGADRFAVPASRWSYPVPECDDCAGGELAGSENHVVVLAVSGGRLIEEDRITVNLPDAVLRVIPASDGWGLLGSSSLTVVDGSGGVRGTLPLG